MTNNDVLRSFRYALELDPARLVEFLAASEVDATPRELAAMLKADDDEGFVAMNDQQLGWLLDGFIATCRGKREPQAGTAPQPGAMTNNRVLRSIRIALELKDTDILAIMELGGKAVSRTELNALFRREDHRNYQPCGDQFLRHFFRGLATWHRRGRPRA